MNKKIIISTIVVIGFFISIFYLTNRLAKAYEYKMTFSSSNIIPRSKLWTRHASDNEKEVNITVKEFITKESQSDFREKLMVIKGVKSIDFGKSCPETKVMKISVTFDNNETSKDNILSEINKLGIEAKEYNSCPHGESNQQECPYMNGSNREIESNI